jgi:hydroxymethylpyrimidine pyrophosphatase-like HAD family hydrolase
VDGVVCRKLGQNGNHALDEAGELIWEEKLSETEVAGVREHIEQIPVTSEVADKDDMNEERGCQVSYRLLRHNEHVPTKEAFDPKSEKRKAILAEYPFTSDSLQVKIGGTTCLDYTAKGRNKGFYVTRLIEQMGWNKEDCLYFGDMLFPGGNDESVIGVIDTQAVDNPDDTLRHLLSLEETE